MKAVIPWLLALGMVSDLLGCEPPPIAVERGMLKT